MHHEMMAGPSGTFIGHLIPGLALIAIGLWWVSEMYFKGPYGKNDSIERSLVFPILKILLLPVALFLEMPSDDWYLMDWAMGWHHITIYMAFALSGIVDLLARKDILSSRATYFAFAGANLIGVLLFYGHGTGPGVEGTCHSIIVFLFFVISLFTLIEFMKPEWNFAWYRIGALLGLGVWMCISAFLIFKMGWDLHDHVREAFVWLNFSWMILGVATLTVALSIIAEKRWKKVN